MTSDSEPLVNVSGETECHYIHWFTIARREEIDSLVDVNEYKILFGIRSAVCAPPTTNAFLDGAVT